MTVADKIVSIKELLDSGLVTQTEYEELKKGILADTALAFGVSPAGSVEVEDRKGTRQVKYNYDTVVQKDKRMVTTIAAAVSIIAVLLVFGFFLGWLNSTQNQNTQNEDFMSLYNKVNGTDITVNQPGTNTPLYRIPEWMQNVQTNTMEDLRGNRRAMTLNEINAYNASKQADEIAQWVPNLIFGKPDESKKMGLGEQIGRGVVQNTLQLIPIVGQLTYGSSISAKFQDAYSGVDYSTVDEDTMTIDKDADNLSFDRRAALFGSALLEATEMLPFGIGNAQRW
jgi:hypothetical protein